MTSLAGTAVFEFSISRAVNSEATHTTFWRVVMGKSSVSDEMFTLLGDATLQVRGTGRAGEVVWNDTTHPGVWCALLGHLFNRLVVGTDGHGGHLGEVPQVANNGVAVIDLGEIKIPLRKED